MSGEGLMVYRLREAKKLIAAMRAEMAADPALRRSQDPFVRGQRAALADLDERIKARIAEIQAAV
jgi:hypothetical protein